MHRKLIRAAMFGAALIMATPAVSDPFPDIEAVDASTSDTARAFGQPQALGDISISPSGRWIARTTQQDSLYRFEVWDTQDLSAPRHVYQLSRFKIANWVLWKDDDHLLVSVSIPGDRFGFVFFETRLLAFDPSMTRRVEIPQIGRRRPTGYPAIQDQVISLLPEDPGGILMAFNWTRPGEPAIQRADLTTGHLTMIKGGIKDIGAWISDPAGREFVGLPTDGDTDLYRGVRDRPFVAEVVEGKGDNFSVLAMDGGSTRLAVLSDHESGPIGAYIYDVTQRRFTDTLYKSDKHDAEGVVMSPDGSHVAGVVWSEDRKHVRWITAEAEARYARLRSLAGAADPYVLAQTPDGRHVVVAVHEGSRPSEHLLVDMTAETVRSLWRVSPALDGRPAGAVSAVKYASADGLEIPGYVTLPPGVKLDEARNLPFVVLPHGGPYARDRDDFDFLAQFIAALGYGVLQPNYRGSSGYGDAYRRLGERQWGEAVLSDVSSGARWLAAAGLADPSRICVVGWSFGGYLALMSAAETVDLYRCAGAIAPVTDIPEIIDYSMRFAGGREEMARMFGVGWKDHARNARASPVNRAAEMRIPIFMANGTGDDIVPLSQARNMYRQMSSHDVDVHILQLPGADHSMSRQQDRTRLLASLEHFLTENLGEVNASTDDR